MQIPRTGRLQIRFLGDIRETSAKGLDKKEKEKNERGGKMKRKERRNLFNFALHLHLHLHLHYGVHYVILLESQASPNVSTESKDKKSKVDGSGEEKKQRINESNLLIQQEGMTNTHTKTAIFTLHCIAYVVVVLEGESYRNQPP